jgi:predicted NUDIX family NTP pyrophosphohydrolase
MGRQSAGILLYRKSVETEVFLVHPGGPLFKKKDAGSWTVPKGEYTSEENPLEAAKREFQEETGSVIDGEFLALQPVKQKGGKVVAAWALEGDLDPDRIQSNTFEMKWPPGSEQMQTFPEIDKGAWFSLDTAREKINERQIPFLDELEALLNKL